MKKLQMTTAAVGILLTLAGSSFAATRVHRGFDSYASGPDRSGAYYYGPVGGQAYGAQSYVAQDRTAVQPQYNGGQNLPYPDRPYGAPDNW